MNPFRDGIVSSPWQTTGIDVNSIHDNVFQACLSGIDHVRKNHRSSSLLIHGEAGSGKTHLLRRLRGSLAPRVPPSTEREECLFVWVRLQTSPRMIWRAVRRTLVDDWFRPVRNDKSQFERILFHRLAQIRIADGDLERWYEYILDTDPAALKDLMDQIATTLDLDRNTAVAFEHLAFQRHLRDLRAWLSGDSLPEAALARMDLAQDEGTDEEREEQSRQVVLMLCRLAGEKLPILISFDQVEALEMYPGDYEGLYSFGQVTSSLHDGTSNVFIVSCVQSTFANQLKDQARQADYARMASQGAMSLDPLTRTQALQLIAARLKDANIAVPKDAPDASCWPLSPAEMVQLTAPGTLTPRRLLSVCAERFETQNQRPATGQTVVPVDDPVPIKIEQPELVTETFFKDKWTSSCEEKLANNSPAMTEEIVRHGLPLLIRLVAPDVKSSHDSVLQDVTLQFEIGSRRVGLSICTSQSMTSLAAQLKRLKSQISSSRLERLGIVRDGRVPISQGAKIARQVLDELGQHPKAFFVRPSPEVLAALDALRALLTDAKSGDLNYRGEAVEPQTVEAWLRANLSSDLKDLANEVLGQPTQRPAVLASDSHDLEALATLLATRPILKLDEAALALQKSRNDLIELVHKYPAQVGFVAGNPEILFRPTET